MLLKKVPPQRWLIRLIPIVFLALFVSTLTFTFLNGSVRRKSFSLEDLPICDADPNEANAKNQTFTVILWTNYFNVKNHSSFDESPTAASCPFRNCKFSQDRTKVTESDAVVFHQADMSLKDLPASKTSRQRWVMFNQESPLDSLMLSPAYDNLFNWSMTYHSWADVRVPFFEVCRELQNSSLDDFDGHQGQKLSKAWSAVWFVSNCHSPSNRMAYVEQLQDFIHIDIVGACSPQNLQCPKSQHESCLKALLPKYRFVLAFENAICDDYVTDKLSDVLPFDIIPIFWGGVDYGKFLPRESFVVASDYPRPKDLARALYRFKNDDLFRKTVAHRRSVRARKVNWKCRLCEKLNLAGDEASVRGKLYEETQRSGRCKVWRRENFYDYHLPF